MKKIFIFLVLIVLLVAAMPVQAYWKDVQGELIHLDEEFQTYPPNTPFFIAPGWMFDPANPDGPKTLGLFEFRLTMDDKPVDPDFVYHWAWGNPPENVFPGQKMANGTLWVFNFPEGLEGEHTFKGFWYEPCSYLNGPQNCPHPNELVQTDTSQTTVTFTE